MEMNSEISSFNLNLWKAIWVHKSKYGLGAFAGQNIAKNTDIGGKLERSALFLTTYDTTHHKPEYVALICDVGGQAQILAPSVRF